MYKGWDRLWTEQDTVCVCVWLHRTDSISGHISSLFLLIFCHATKKCVLALMAYKERCRIWQNTQFASFSFPKNTNFLVNLLYPYLKNANIKISFNKNVQYLWLLLYTVNAVVHCSPLSAASGWLSQSEWGNWEHLGNRFSYWPIND